MTGQLLRLLGCGAQKLRKNGIGHPPVAVQPGDDLRGSGRGQGRGLGLRGGSGRFFLRDGARNVAKGGRILAHAGVEQDLEPGHNLTERLVSLFFFNREGVDGHECFKLADKPEQRSGATSRAGRRWAQFVPRRFQVQRHYLKPSGKRSKAPLGVGGAATVAECPDVFGGGRQNRRRHFKNEFPVSARIALKGVVFVDLDLQRLEFG